MPFCTISPRLRFVAQINRIFRLIGSVAAEPLEIALLQHPQQFRLQPQPQVANLIQKQSSLIGCFKPAAPAHQRAGKRSFFVTKKLVFNQSFGQDSRMKMPPEAARCGRSTGESLAPVVLFLFRSRP